MKEIDFRNNICKNLTPYVSGEQIQDKKIIKLNTNENPYPPTPKISKFLIKLAKDLDLLKKYPNAVGEPLRSAIAQKWDLKNEQVFVSNGSDEALSLICRAFLEPKEKAIFSDVTYSLYSTLVESVGGCSNIISSINRENNNFTINLDEISKAEGKLVFLPNPNAPTGEFIDINILKKYIQNSDKLWVIDEAYNDFVEDENSSFIPFINEFSNVIVLRTFSKSYSLAGSRIGYAVSSNKFIMKSFYGLKDSYNEDILSVHIGKIAIKDKRYFHKITQKIISQRKILTKKLQKLKFKVMPSEANFLFVLPPENISAEKI